MQFFQELYSHIDKKSGGKFEDMFLIKISNKRTSLTVKNEITATFPAFCNKSHIIISCVA